MKATPGSSVSFPQGHSGPVHVLVLGQPASHSRRPRHGSGGQEAYRLGVHASEHKRERDPIAPKHDAFLDAGIDFGVRAYRARNLGLKTRSSV